MTQRLHFPPLAAVLEAHERLLERYGGASGLRDPGGLEAALARPQQLIAYSEAAPNLFVLTAALAYGIIRIHHPFVDGNKRTGFFALIAMLRMNGWTLDTGEAEAADTIERLAAGEMEEAALVTWIERNAQPLGR
jgi:death-on-curing protein